MEVRKYLFANTNMNVNIYCLLQKKKTNKKLSSCTQSTSPTKSKLFLILVATLNLYCKCLHHIWASIITTGEACFGHWNSTTFFS